ncbi:mitochondrial import receptor subunit TOM20 homolog isoform X2 [Dermacentor albipictus]
MVEMSVMVSKTALSVAAGVCGTLFIGYCIYFDRKRRSDPLFKQKLKERRAKAQQQKEQARSGSGKLPDLKDYDAVQKFFIHEVQMGEELLAQGDIENGVEHLSSAVAVCGQPQQLLQVLQQTLPPQVFHLLLQRLPVVSQRLADSAGGPPLVEDDVE